jgi:aspartyl-tRNA(Asn)/glutamyl-tRNA(Gln) amidotransferase subunit B
MDLQRRKLFGDRITWLLVAAATFVVVQQYLTRGGDARLYLVYAWSGVVALLLFVGELRIGRRRPKANEGSFFAGVASLLGDETIEPDGSRRRSWTGSSAGVMDLGPPGIAWEPRRADSGPPDVVVAWPELYSFRLRGVLPLVRRASGYLVISVVGGRELVFHVHGVSRWRKALRHAAIVGPTRVPAAAQPVAAPEPEVAAPAPEAAVAEPEHAAASPEPEVATPESARDVDWEPVIGLECHVELSTRSKVFCACPTAFGAAANSQVCPVCTGQPGSLPVLNEAAVEHAIRIALALNCKITARSIFHRKNYFYPDMPKNYQISQYDVPLATEGHLDVEAGESTRRIRIHRVHLEEDTGKTTHLGGTGRISAAEGAHIDYNRAGVPLVEIVSEPDISGADEARAYLAELRQLLLFLGVSDVRMEEGSLRCDANVSVRPRGAMELGVKTEVKNLNSIRSLGRALEFEISRLVELASAGKRIAQETRHFDEASGKTMPGRSKEYADDYRYFADPDLVPLEPSAAWIERIRSTLPEPPAARRRRFSERLGLPLPTARALTATAELADAFEEALRSYGGQAPAIARWYTSELAAIANERGVGPHEAGVPPSALADLQRMIDERAISDSQAKTEILREMVASGKGPREIVAESGRGLISDESELVGIVDQVIASNADVVEKIKAGKDTAIGALVGQAMRATQGRADAKAVQDLIRRRIADG